MNHFFAYKNFIFSLMLFAGINLYNDGLFCQSQRVESNLSPAVEELSPEWVRQYSSESASSNLEQADITADHEGNVYSLLSNSTTFHGLDFLLVKYNQSGKKVWTSRYDGPDHFTDQPKSLTVDANNNVYVTGSCYNFEDKGALTTIKYNENGEQIWVNRFENTLNGSVEARGIMVSESGSIYVFALIKESGYWTEDFLTLRIDVLGNTLWWKRFDSGQSDDPKCWTVDRNDNVIVSGKSGNDRAVVKYNKDGEELWFIHYQDSKVDGYGFESFTICNDNDGNIYLAGPEGWYYSEDFYLAKYSPNGTFEWVKKFGKTTNTDPILYNYDHKVLGIKADNSGSITIIGSYQVANSDTIFTMLNKVDSDGNILLGKLIQASSSTRAYPKSANIDKNGNIFVFSEIYDRAGVNITKYDPSLNELWKINDVGWGPNKIKVSDDGNIFTLSRFQDENYVNFNLISSYSSIGDFQWSDKFKDTVGTTNDNIISTVYGNGNVYVTASSDGSLFGKSQEVLTLAYDKEGNLLWNKRYSKDPFLEYPREILSDKTGNIYINGTAKFENGLDAVSLKYNSNGDLLWDIRNYNTYSQYSSTRFDKAGNIYTILPDAGNNEKILVIKYNSSGNEILNSFVITDLTDFPAPNDWDVDNNGNIYVTGSIYKKKSESDYNYYQFMVTAKFNASGEKEWSKFFSDGKSNFGYKILVDFSGNVFICVKSDKNDIIFMYDNNGNEKWNAMLPFTYGKIVGAELDPDGNFLIGGSAYINGTNSYFATKYDSFGNMIWFTSYYFNGINNFSNSSEAADMKIDSFGNIYLIGTSSVNTCTLLKITPRGGIGWTAIYKNENTNDYTNRITSNGKSITFDEEGNIYAAVNTSIYSYTSTSTFVTLLKFHQTFVGIDAYDKKLPGEYKLSQNYPNPFNPSTTINYQIPVAGHVTIKIYDLLGREVSTLVDENKQAGNYKTQFSANEFNLSSGVYFYRLQSGSFLDTKKFVLMK